MKVNYCRWKQYQIRNLFSFIESKTKQGLPLTKAFLHFAEQTGRKANSVRNYYYAELDYLEKNPQQAISLGINLENHKKTTPKYFSAVEAQQCVKDIENLVKQGNSVRKACLILSNGDVDQMVRLQNKYRSLTKNTREMQNQMPANIISMPQKNKHLTQQEIDSLFLGLLKLIKASAKQEVVQNFNKNVESANQQLRKTLVVLAEKERQLKKLQANFAVLEKENFGAKETIRRLRSKQSQKYASNNEKMQALKKYSSAIKDEKDVKVENK